MKTGLSEKIPFSDIESVGIRYLSYTDLFLCTWQLGVFCNYSCSYCWPSSHSFIPDHKPLKVLTQTMDKIKTQAKKQGFNSFRFSFVGGEPTIQKKIIDLIQHYSEDTENCNYQGLHITTNLSQKIRWFERFKNIVSPLDETTISASFHKEFANREEFADKAQFLLESGIFCSINIVMTPEAFYNLLEDAKYFYDRSMSVYLQSQIDFNGRPVSGYTKDMLEKLQTAFPDTQQHGFVFNKFKKKKKRWTVKNPHLIELKDSKNEVWRLDSSDRLNALRFNRYESWECSAGYRSIVIDAKGNIKRGHVCYDKPMGHIKTDFQLHENIKPCVTPICTCTADNKVPKRKEGTKHLLFKSTEQLISLFFLFF